MMDRKGNSAIGLLVVLHKEAAIVKTVSVQKNRVFVQLEFAFAFEVAFELHKCD